MAESGLTLILIFKAWKPNVREAHTVLWTRRGMAGVEGAVAEEERLVYIEDRQRLRPEHIVIWPVGGEPVTLAQLRGT